MPVPLQADAGGEGVGNRGGARHLANHVSRHPRRVGLECQEHQVVHRLQVLSWRFLGDLDVDRIGRHLRLGDVKPVLGSLDPLLDIPDRGEVFIELVLVLSSQPVLQAAGISRTRSRMLLELSSCRC